MENSDDLLSLLQSLPCRGNTYGAEFWISDPNHFPAYSSMFASVDERVGMTSLLEIGTLFGYSLVAALSACPNIDRIHFVDDESGHENSNRMAVENMVFACEKLGRPVPEITCSTTVKGIPGVKWPVVHIDGDHSFKAATADLSVAWECKADIIVGHDYRLDGAGVKRAVDEFVVSRPALELEVEEWPVTFGCFLIDIRPKSKAQETSRE